jgi:hypothetical protein
MKFIIKYNLYRLPIKYIRFACAVDKFYGEYKYKKFRFYAWLYHYDAIFYTLMVIEIKIPGHRIVTIQIRKRGLPYIFIHNTIY